MNNPSDQDWSDERMIEYNENVFHEDEAQQLGHGILLSGANQYNQDWPFEAVLDFNQFIIDECSVTCRWMEHGNLCNEQLKGKDLRTHLHTAHSIVSEWDPYPCLWEGCRKSAMRKSSLERHVEEQHIPVRWACPGPDCGETFSRRSTLRDHVLRFPGHHG